MFVYQRLPSQLNSRLRFIRWILAAPAIDVAPVKSLKVSRVNCGAPPQFEMAYNML